ncbi:hypothetical protein JYU14_02830 [Simkania negevensis]|uniref:Kinase n=1 Tax=Simkania negevensis TaxID=83561 RepID=A0ABS3AVJ7_9BACT|nr:hypothetical protein [Simkania negevensis]
MIISRTPFRVSLFGGGTDYPAWYREHGGAVLATSIDKYCYISCRILPPFFSHKYRIVYSRIESTVGVEEIEHPAVRAILGALHTPCCEAGLEIHHDGDLPAHSGLGSSSSFTVGLIHALKALQGKMMSKRELAKTAIHIEQDLIKEDVGSQDQVTAAYGGFNKINFLENGTWMCDPLIIGQERLMELQDHLMLFFTGLSRLAPKIARSKIDNMKNRQRELKYIQELVEEGEAILTSSEAHLPDIGKLLHESWLLKRSLSDKVSTPRIDQIYQAALDGGAMGGKIIGAGGGGFLLLFCKPEKQPQVREALKKLTYVSFAFEHSGSKIVVYEPLDFQAWDTRQRSKIDSRDLESQYV